MEVWVAAGPDALLPKGSVGFVRLEDVEDGVNDDGEVEERSVLANATAFSPKVTSNPMEALQAVTEAHAKAIAFRQSHSSYRIKATFRCLLMPQPD